MVTGLPGDPYDMARQVPTCVQQVGRTWSAFVLGTLSVCRKAFSRARETSFWRSACLTPPRPRPREVEWLCAEGVGRGVEPCALEPLSETSGSSQPRGVSTVGLIFQMCEPTQAPCGHIWKAVYSGHWLLSSVPSSFPVWEVGGRRGQEAQEGFCRGNCLEFPKLQKLQGLSPHKTTPSFLTPTASSRGSHTTPRLDHSWERHSSR